MDNSFDEECVNIDQFGKEIDANDLAELYE